MSICEAFLLGLLFFRQKRNHICSGLSYLIGNALFFFILILIIANQDYLSLLLWVIDAFKDLIWFWFLILSAILIPVLILKLTNLKFTKTLNLLYNTSLNLAIGVINKFISRMTPNINRTYGILWAFSLILLNRTDEKIHECNKNPQRYKNP